MRALASVAALTCIALSVLADGPPRLDGAPPSIEYKRTRESKDWVDTPTGRVPVDDGIEWQGVKVYLTLLSDVVAVDATSKKTLWSDHGSAFWNAMTFKEVETAPGKKTWAVELRSTSANAEEKKLRLYLDLKTGKRLEPPSAGASLGKLFVPRKSCSGDVAELGHPFQVIVTTADNWTKLRARMFGERPVKDLPESKEIDFHKEVVLVVSLGDATNCNGISAEGAWEDDKRVLVRLRHHTFQTSGPDGGAVKARPHGIMLLPRTSKAYVLERNRQRYIGAPPLWVEQRRFDKLGDPASELDQALMPRAAK